MNHIVCVYGTGTAGLAVMLHRLAGFQGGHWHGGSGSTVAQRSRLCCAVVEGVGQWWCYLSQCLKAMSP